MKRHWIIAYNELTDECIFMQLEECLPFKYRHFEDVSPIGNKLAFTNRGMRLRSIYRNAFLPGKPLVSLPTFCSRSREDGWFSGNPSTLNTKTLNPQPSTLNLPLI